MTYASMFRTNYVKVKNLEDLKAYLGRYEMNIQIWEDNGHVAFGCFENGIPDIVYIEEFDDYVDVDFLMDLAGYLEEDQILVVQQIGNEGLRYLDGCAWAVHPKGEILQTMLDDIYDMAYDKWALADGIPLVEY